MGDHPDFFASVYDHWANQIFLLLAFLVIEVPGNLLLWGIVWFERYSDQRSKTLINHLNCLTFSCGLAYNLVVMNIVFLRTISGPLPEIVSTWYEAVARMQIEETSL